MRRKVQFELFLKQESYVFKAAPAEVAFTGRRPDATWAHRPERAGRRPGRCGWPRPNGSSTCNVWPSAAARETQSVDTGLQVGDQVLPQAAMRDARGPMWHRRRSRWTFKEPQVPEPGQRRGAEPTGRALAACRTHTPVLVCASGAGFGEMQQTLDALQVCGGGSVQTSAGAPRGLGTAARWAVLA